MKKHFTPREMRETQSLNSWVFLCVALISAVCLLTSCGTSERKSLEPWTFEDLKYRTVHYRADQGRWNVFQYQATHAEARQHREWMIDLLEVRGARPLVVIERKD
jgi:hypothetical protein